MSTLGNVTVTTAATSRLLCERATVKTELGISDTSQDTKLDRLILAFSIYAAGPEGIGREPWLQTYLERTPGLGGHYLWLSRFPALSITSVYEGTGDSPSLIDSTTYSLAGSGAGRDRLYRVNGWSRHALCSPEHYGSTTGPALAYAITYSAGWAMPGQITTWSVGATVASGAWFKALAGTDYGLIFRAGGAGTTHATTEPTWPSTPGGTVTDNTVTWTAYDQRLPQDIEQAALIQVMDWYGGGLEIPTGISSESFAGHTLVYSGTNTAIGRSGTALSTAVKTILQRYR